MLQEADLAITDLTITSERESAVDFTMPFMNLGTAFQNRRIENCGLLKNYLREYCRFESNVVSDNRNSIVLYVITDLFLFGEL